MISPRVIVRHLSQSFRTQDARLLVNSFSRTAKVKSRLQPNRAFGAITPRHLSSSMATKQEWLVIVPDHANALEKRVAIRPQHLENVKPVVEAGKVLAGGATLAEPLKPGEKPQMTGSLIIAQADTEAEVRAMLEHDIYVDSGVWNWDAVQITPIKIAVRKGQPDLGI